MKRWQIAGEPSADVIDELAAILVAGGVALLPTDTIYGLHAAVSNDAAAARIRAMKGRDGDKPFVVIAASIAQLRGLGVDVPEALAGVWPAPLTAVVASGAKSVAVRIPDVPWLRDLLGRTGPLISTSANRSGEAPIIAPEYLAHDLQIQLDALVDAGLCQGKPSTIVDFTGAEPRLIREGDPSFTQNLWKRLRKAL